MYSDVVKHENIHIPAAQLFYPLLGIAVTVIVLSLRIHTLILLITHPLNNYSQQLFLHPPQLICVAHLIWT